MCQFTDVLGLQQYSLYMQDYGGPVGFRMALARSERVQALIIQNAVVHEEGLTPAWDLRRSYWNNRAEYEAKIREGMVSVQAGMARHIGDRPNPEHFNPDLWMDEIAFLKRPGMERLDEVRTSVLVVMGEKDPDFPDPAIEARWIADQVKGELLMVPGAGHYPQAEFPELVSPAAVEFVRRITPSLV
jgi:pimeloyl-ACP methyl ester carboxylesterase